jgi:hypothetical protein
LQPFLGLQKSARNTHTETSYCDMLRVWGRLRYICCAFFCALILVSVIPGSLCALDNAQFSSLILYTKTTFKQAHSYCTILLHTWHKEACSTYRLLTM